jgi:UTP--glucose-1-phosphate uridylyltransferase
MYAYDFEGRRYDVGDKLGFLEATVEFALKREDLQKPFLQYLNSLKHNENFKALYTNTISE